MIKDVIESITTAAKKLFTNWGALLISFLLYAALIVVLYLFFTTREATLLQVVLSLTILPIAAIILFFTLQAMGLSYVRVGVGPTYLLKRALQDCWRILVITLPIVILGWAIYYVLAKVEPYALNRDSPTSQKWVVIAFDFVRWILLAFALPLIAIHLWISAIREGLKGALKSIGTSIKRAFAPHSVLIYVLTALVFGAISYFLLYKRVTFKSEWTELWVVGIKTALALLLVFIGWLLVIGSLAEMTARRAIGEMES